jgi:hypothetical protein
LWLAALILGLDWIGQQADAAPLLGWVPLAALAWTAAIALYLLYTWLLRPDERRLLAELEAVYGDEPSSAEADPPSAGDEPPA